jgi:DNA-binding transcriptional regulator LsrR (DeoR family)
MTGVNKTGLIVACFFVGMSRTRIAKKFGITRKGVCHHLTKAGVTGTEVAAREQLSSIIRKKF